MTINQQVKKVKNHFAENKSAYIAGTLGLVAGASVALLAFPASVANVKQLQILTWKSKQTVEIFVEALGDPGNIIQDTTTGTVYASQGQAARALNVSPSRISEGAGKLE